MRSPRVTIRYLIIALALSLVLLPGVANAQESVYTVQDGDTLYSIAAAFGTTRGAILRVNGLTEPVWLWEGKDLIIPALDSPITTYGETDPSSGTGYVVQAGDTLADIAARFDVSVRAIMSANAMTDPDILFEGMVLVIPGVTGGGTSSGGGTLPEGTTYGSPDAYLAEVQDYLDSTRFVVSVSEQQCWLVQDYRVTGSWPCSTGRHGYETPAGFFAVQSKFPVAYGSRWDFYMPNWMGIYWSGSTENGIHGLPFNEWGKDWADKIGTPISFGCIVLDDAAAEQVYAAAYIGMQVVILD